MDASEVIRNTMIASLGLVISNSTQSVKYFIPYGIECHTSNAVTDSQSSTRLNNSERFSLDQLKSNKRKLESIKQLTPNWNGYEGEKFNETLIANVESILSDLDYQPQIFPTGRGTIQIEKHLNDDNLVEIEVSQNEIFAYQVKNGVEIEKEISATEINNLISDLYA